jgi:ribosomal protein S18 acetylase RimI-like enzyme
MSLSAPSHPLRVRDLEASDLEAVVRIDAAYSGERKPEYWSSVLRDFLGTERGPVRVGLAAESGGRLIGHLLGEIRAFEFGSEPCGWVFSVGVDQLHVRRGVASSLLAAACETFRSAGVERVRTMVRRDDVPVLSFFRAAGLVGGPFVQLELDLRRPR